MAGVDIIPVKRRVEMKAFIDLPWRIYNGDSNWIPPLRSDVARLLNPNKHPFWKFSERELFLARRGKQVVGRIAAIIDGNHNLYHKEKMGIWGFFECTHDPEAAAALFSALERWMRDKGIGSIRGPLNPSTNYEVGMLIRGFDSPPTLMMTYNPSYYLELVHLCGFRKEKDLNAYLFTRDYRLPDWALSLVDRTAKKGEITIRQFDPGDLKNDLHMMNRVYSECWSNNWGFVPMTDKELEVSARNISLILDPEFAFFLYYNDEAVGVCLILPDANPLIKRLNGRLGLFALIKKHLYWSEITGLRGLLLGVKDEYQQMGLPAVVLDRILRGLKKKKQYQYLEMGWTLEDNRAINLLFEECGLAPYKRYRIYRKDLSS